MDPSVTLAQEAAQSASTIQLVGAGCFGAIIGWYVYYINRYRDGGVQFSDLVTVIGIIGGGTVLALFQSQTDLFGAYGIGLAVGFFGYFLALLILVRVSDNFNADWFLDGRRRWPQAGFMIPDEVTATARAMGDRPSGGGSQTPQVPSGAGSGTPQVPGG
jgi:hypothetical protein